MATKRRANGEGSWWQLPDRTWVHQITVGRKENGSPERKAFKGKTKAICKQRKEEWLAERERLTALAEKTERDEAEKIAMQKQLGHSPESEILFENAFTEWLRLYKSPPTRKPSTYARYLDVYHTHFAPAFGEMPLHQISQDVIQEYYQKKQLNGARMDGRSGRLSPKTIRNHHMILKDFFAYAQSKYKLPCNPVLNTARPEVVAKGMRVLTPSEMQIFMEEVMKEAQRIVILTDLFVGLRVGELLALEIADLNLERQTLRINKNLIRVKTEALSLDNPSIRILDYDPQKKTHLIIQSTPKTKTSNREIAISDGLCELLIRHLYTLAYSSWPNPGNLLFPSRAGTHIDPKSFEIRLSAVSKRCEIKKVNPHALRHTLATRLVEERMPLNIVQGILGHASIETTRKCLHKNEDIEREAITSMTNYIDLTTGLRRGELLGLKWTDVDLEKGDLRVRRQTGRIDGKIIEMPLKTKNAYRTLPLSADAIDVLMQQRRKTGNSEWVFPSPTGGPMSPDSVLHMLHRVLKRAGLPEVRFHDLRHTFATLALQNGVDIKTVSGMLGHFSAGFTLDTYAHVTTSAKREAAKTMGNILSGAV